MTKKTKRIIALVLAMVLALISFGSLAVFADEGGIMPIINNTDETGSITIVNNNGRNSSDFGLYALLFYNPTTGAYSSSALGRDFWTYLGQNGKQGDHETLYSYITSLNGDPDKINAFSADLLAYLKTGNNKTRYMALVENVGNGQSKPAPKVQLGYYAVVDLTNTNDPVFEGLVNLDTADKSIYIKPDRPTLDKKIVRQDDERVDSVEAEINDEITFEIKGALPEYSGYQTYSYTIVDELGKGFTLPEGFNSEDTTLKITIGGAELDWEDYTLTVEGDDPQVITIVMDETTLANYNAGDEIVVTYTVTLNKDATVATANKNTAKAKYTFAGKTEETTEEETDVWTNEFDFTKVADGLNVAGGDTILYAKFNLYEWNESTKQYDLVKLSKDAEGGFYYANPDAENNGVTLDFGENIPLKGLSSGKYKLVEQGSAYTEGYNTGDEYKGHLEGYEFDVVITTNEDGSVITNAVFTPSNGRNDAEWNDIDARGWIGMSKLDKEQRQIHIKVVNTKEEHEEPLPETGGIGTIIFTIVGLALMIGAASVVFTSTRKRTA